MWQYLYNKYCTGAYPKSSYQFQIALWCAVGLHSGCRLSEYAQDSSHKTFGNHATVRGSQETRALHYQTLLSSPPGVHALPTRTAITNRSRIGRIQLTWRYQKNGDNGQRKTFTRGKTIDLANCLADIIENFLHLCPTAPASTPIGVYKTTNGRVCYIHDTTHQRTPSGSCHCSLQPRSSPGQSLHLLLYISLHSRRCMLHPICSWLTTYGHQTYTPLEIRHFHDLPPGPRLHLCTTNRRHR